MRVISVAKKLCAVEEWRREQVDCLKRILQKQRPQHRKTVLGFTSGEDGFSSSEICHDRRTGPRTKLSASAQKQGPW